MTPFYIGNSIKNLNKRYSQKNFHWNLIIGGGVFMVLCLYLLEINSAANFNFKIDDLKQRIGELQINNQDAELNLRQNDALEQLSSWASTAGMVAINSSDYLTASDATVAVK